MKFECGKKHDERLARKRSWHRWFAWYPAKVGAYDCRWWEYVERRREYYYEGGGYWEYRSVNDKTTSS